MNAGTFSPAWARHGFGAAVLISSLCFVVTLFGGALSGKGQLIHKLTAFGLSGENTIGAWWSGMLLLLVALHSFDGFLRHRHSRLASSGWLCLGALMCLLSMDEVGSVHERIDGGMWLLAGLSAAGGLYTVGALFLGGQRASAVTIACGFAVLALALVQDELLEDLAFWRSHQHLRQALEEGTEIAGMLVLLRVAMANTFAPASGAVDGLRRPFGAVNMALLPVMIGGLMIGPVFAYMSASLREHARGNVSAWLAATALFVAAVVVLPNPARTQEQRGDGARVALAFICMVGSALVVWISAFRYPVLNKVVFATISAAVVAAWHVSCLKERRHADRWLLVSLVVSLVLMQWAAQSLTVTYWVEAAVAMLVLFGNAAIMKRGESQPAWEDDKAPLLRASSEPRTL